jgi:hypothetical protein
MISEQNYIYEGEASMLGNSSKVDDEGLKREVSDNQGRIFGP